MGAFKAMCGHSPNAAFVSLGWHDRQGRVHRVVVLHSAALALVGVRAMTPADSVRLPGHCFHVAVALGAAGGPLATDLRLDVLG
ncbi:hypothetical protein D3C76_1055430 [compost metagenome]